ALLQQRRKRALHHERAHRVADQHERTLGPGHVLHCRDNASKSVLKIAGRTDVVRDGVAIPEGRLAPSWQLRKGPKDAGLWITVPRHVDTDDAPSGWR